MIKMKTELRFLLLWVVVMLSTGCASMMVTDNVPPGSPKGYVEFYQIGYGVTKNELSSEGDIKVFLEGRSMYPEVNPPGGYSGRIYPITIFDYKSFRRIANVPGEYEYWISPGVKFGRQDRYKDGDFNYIETNSDGTVKKLPVKILRSESVNVPIKEGMITLVRVGAKEINRNDTTFDIVQRGNNRGAYDHW